MSDASEREVRSRRAPRKRATRQRTADKEQRVSEVPKKPVEEKKVAPIERKAPTPIASTKKANKTKQKRTALALVILVFGFGCSVAIGYSDKGQIDVGGIITERNKKAQDEGDTRLINVPVQNRQADGGLVGMGDLEPASPPEPVATTTASSSDETASSTDEIVEDEVEADEQSE